MAWENRGKRSYYYRKKREDGGVTSEYIGNGSSAQLISELAGRERQKRLLARAQRRRQELDMKKVDADFECLAKMVHALVQAALLISGYHPHKGQWRRRRYV